MSEWEPLSSRERIKIREIGEHDVKAVIDLLVRGFRRSRCYWSVAFARLRTRLVPISMPRYGYILEAGHQLVGVLLLISTLRRTGNQQSLFSNISSWYVEPAYRSYGALLYKRAIASNQTTYLNLSATTHVRRIVEGFGFERYTEGQVAAPLALARNQTSASVRIIGADNFAVCNLDESERRLLENQAEYGCIAFCCLVHDRCLPFVFVPRVVKEFIPCAQLAYCRDIADLAEVAGFVGRHLLRFGRLFVLIDANGPIHGIPGKYYRDLSPRYYKGLARPITGDLAETEVTIFGL